jgi:methionyl-tRNA formyltransferase
MAKLSFAFLGATKQSKELLLFLIKKNFIPKLIMSIPEKFNISYSDKKVKNMNYANLNGIADKYNIDFVEIDSVDGKRLIDYKKTIKKLDLDLILVMGWYYLIPKSIRKLAKKGAWGFHSSLLPKYAGGAPLTWAIINDEKETGVTFFRFKDGIDNGDIISQKSFKIEYEDTIKEVLKKSTIASKEILSEVFENIENVNFIPQKKGKIKIYPQRKPEDGEIDLKKTASEIYNFIRAQSSPYPGAFIKTADGKKIIIEKAKKK